MSNKNIYIFKHNSQPDGLFLYFMNCEEEQEGDQVDGHAGQGPALGAGAQGGVIQRSGQRGD